MKVLSVTAKAHSSSSGVEDLQTGGGCFDPQAQPIFFLRIYDSHCNMIHSSLTAVHCFDNGYLGKQAVAWIEYCVEYWLKELQESMDRCTGHCDITKILFWKNQLPFKSYGKCYSCLTHYQMTNFRLF